MRASDNPRRGLTRAASLKAAAAAGAAELAGVPVPPAQGTAHGDPAAIPGPLVVATATTTNGSGREATFTATVYPGPKGNWVFNAPTIFWAMGLSQPPGIVPPYSHFGRPHGSDERVRRITANFLRRCGANPSA